MLYRCREFVGSSTVLCRRWGGRCTAGLAIAGLVLGLGSGCGILNPDLLGTLGANSAVAGDVPEGHVVLLITNSTTSTVEATVLITKSNGATAELSFGTGPVPEDDGYTALVQPCDVTSIDVQSFGYATPNTTGGPVEIPSNLGTLVRNESFHCGSVIQIQAAGTPPTFTVEVY